MAEPAEKFATWATKRPNSRLNVDRHVGARIRERRISLGLTVPQMAELISVRPEQARKYEKGTSSISSNRLYHIARALGVDVSYLFEDKETTRPSRELDIDRHVAARLRVRRIMLGFTQTQAAQLIGVGSQQLQRYEKGLSTISAERLYLIAQALGVEISYFFQETERENRLQETPQRERMLLELVRNFTAIENPTNQDQVLGLIRALAEADTRMRPAPDTVRRLGTAAPVKFVAKLMDTWAIGEGEAARLLGLEDEMDVRDLISGAKQLDTRDAKDRVRHLLRIREALHGLFRDVHSEREWMHEARPELNGQSPLALLLEGAMESLLTVSQLAQWMVGR